MDWIWDNIPRIIGCILFFGVVGMILSEMINRKQD